MKRVLIITVLVMVLFGAGFGVLFAEGNMEGNGAPSSEQTQTRATEQAMLEANAQVGMPTINNFLERKLMKMILELRDRADLVCYAYSYSTMTGRYTYIGRCIGYGLPYSVQYTNPLKMRTVNGGQAGALNPYTTPQPDPNGLYMPDSLDATWVMLIDEETGEPSPMYMEPSLVVNQFPLPARICLDGINK